MSTRAYLPTFAELVDRLTIVQQKAIFIPEKKADYTAEMGLIMQDIDAILTEKSHVLKAADIRAVAAVMLANHAIWNSESKARAGGSDQDKLLKFTHSINGVRNRAKNALAASIGERLDHKTDCFAAELVEEFGNWNIFEDQV
jgi:hypothetical protein